jgi:ABC-type polysaccharide/polyol phosphate export permease
MSIDAAMIQYRSMSARTPGRWYDAGFRELASLWSHRNVLKALARHDLRRTYAGSAAGVLWAVITPLVPLLIFTVVFSLGLRLPLGRAPYIFGFAAAYVPWVLVSNAITGAAGSIVDHRHLVKRVLFPVEIIPANPILVHSLPHAILIVLTGAACFLGGYGRFPQLLSLLYFYACAVMLTISAGLFLAALAVVVRDAQQILPSFLNAWFWITPIAWAASSLPPAGRRLMALNPASYIVSGYRYALMPSVFPPPELYETTAFWSIAIAMLLIASAAFRRLREHFWECL